MHHLNPEEELRPIVLMSVEGKIVGKIPINPDARTLDWLNRDSGFLSVDAESLDLPDCNLLPGHLVMNKPLVVFVAEHEFSSPKTDKRVEATHFRRCAMTVRAGDCDISGYIHVRDEMDIVRHLSRAAGPFFAMTSASIVGPDFELVTNFVAINVTHVVAVQPVAADQEEQTTSAGGVAEVALP